MARRRRRPLLCSIVALTIAALIWSHSGVQDVYEELQMLNFMEVEDNEAVFVLETTMNPRLSPRACCSVESIARAMKNRTVFLIMRSRHVGTAHQPTMALTSIPNIKFRTIDVEAVLSAVNLTSWYRDQFLKHPKLDYINLSDVLRAVLLYLFGGLYVDSDVIVQKAMDDLPLEFIGIQSFRIISIGVMRLRRHTPIAEMWIRKIGSTSYDGAFGRIGVYLLTRLILKHCHQPNVSSLYAQQSKCNHILPPLLPPSYFYEIPYGAHEMFLKPHYANITMKLINGSHAAHIWNYLNSDRKIPPFPPTAYHLLASKYCPSVFSATEGLF